MSIKDWPGGVVSKDQVVPSGPYSNSTASGIWTMDQVANYTKQGIWPTAGNVEPDVASVFSTFLYEGNNSTLTVNNGIDLSGEGGLVWVKNRDNVQDHILTDSSSSGAKYLNSNTSTQQQDFYIGGGSDERFFFNSTGFSTTTADFKVNNSSYDYASWSFRKAKKFYDVVTYTGNGSNRTIAHNLGSVPGMIITKRLDGTSDWGVYHRSYGPGGPAGILNGTDAAFNLSTYWNNTNPTSDVFSLGSFANVNTNGATYVAYLFAHETDAASMIQCGGYTGNGSATGPVINLGWQPQWLMIKNTSSTYNWIMLDTMRGFSAAPSANTLFANTSAVEDPAGTRAQPTSTGFEIITSSFDYNKSGDDFIYMAIRAPMMIAPTAGTQVFYPSLVTATQANQTKTGVGFSADVIINLVRSNANYGQQITSRLTGVNKQMFTSSDSAESTTNGTALTSLNQDGYSLGSDSAGTGWNAYSGYTSCKLNFKRGKGCIDVVAYNGTGVAGRTVAHSLGVVPEMMWVKQRPYTSSWRVYHSALGNVKALTLNDTVAAYNLTSAWNSTTPTASVFTLGSSNDVNENGLGHIAYLFATLDGISKVGSYTGTAATLSVDCGFTGGARFVLIKRTDATGDWYIWDSARGISAGNDPYMALNSASAEVTGTDYVDPLNTGFTVTSSAPAGLNANGGNYIFYAIA